MRLVLIYFFAYVKNNLLNLIWIIFFTILMFVFFTLFLGKEIRKQYLNTLQCFLNIILLSLNCSFIFVLTLFGREMQRTRILKLMPLESYYTVFTGGDAEILLQIIMNIVMYIPLSFLLPCCFRVFAKYRYIVFTAFISSLSIELIQIIFKVGLFEIDDIINNVMGGVIGIGLYELCFRLKTLLVRK